MWTLWKKTSLEWVPSERTLLRSIGLKGNLHEGAYCQGTRSLKFLLVNLLQLAFLEWLHFERNYMSMILPDFERVLPEGTFLEVSSWGNLALVVDEWMEASE